MLRSESSLSSDVYPFFDTLAEMINNTNSYIRTRGLLLIAANAKWDVDYKVAFVIGMTFFGLNIPVYAQVPLNSAQLVQADIPIMPQWINTNDVLLNLYFANDNAECTGIINGVAGTSKITATFKLERKGIFGWSLENSWSESSKGDSLSFFEMKSVVSGYTYRFSVTAEVVRNGITETINTSVERKY